MGQTNQSPLSDDKQLIKIFSIQGRVKEHNLTYLEHLQTHKQYILRQTTFAEETDQLQMLTQLKQRQSFGSSHLTNLVKYEHNKKEDLCSKYYRIHSLWQSPRRTLAEEINERALAKQPFPPGQLTLMIKQISEGMLTLQKQKISHECLTTKSILVQGPINFRVVDPLTLPMHHNLDVVYHKRSVKNIYLSPEQCRIVDSQDLSKSINDQSKSDVFTAGMIILEAALLRRQDNCYEDECARINWKQIQLNLCHLAEIYGEQIRHYLELMLRQLPHERIDWQKLSQLIQVRQHQSVIRMSRMAQSPKVKTQESVGMRKSVTFNYQSTARTPITLQARPPTVSYAVKREPQRVHPPKQIITYPQTHQIIVRPPSQPNGQIGRIVQSVVRHPTESNTVVQPNTIFNYSNYSQPAVAKEPMGTTNSKTYQSSAPKDSSLHRITQTPRSQSPQRTFEFDQTEPTYTVDQFKNGGKYQGYKFKGKREGWGKYTYNEGGCYQGEWKNDLMCGKGKLYYQSGKLAYDGYLQDDLFHGTGILFNQEPQNITQTFFNYKNFDDIDEYWISYEGQFRHDKKQGHGKLTLSNGQYLQGSFHDDKVEGEGTYHATGGQIISGIWHQSIFQRQL